MEQEGLWGRRQMRVLVTGGAGRLGRRLVEMLTARGYEVDAADTTDFDITDYEATRERIGASGPQIVLHTAAWTDVDGCARDPERAVRLNGLGAGNVALAAAAVGAALLYVSSNEVFDGRASRPYGEYDRPAPINPYGYSKWVGEQAVMQALSRCYIVRTAWLFAHGGKNFIHSILRAAQAGQPLRVVIDEIANPTYNDDLAEAIIALIGTGRFGIYHLVNEGACSRYAFARYALERAGLGHIPIEPIALSQWARPSTPPRFAPLQNLAAASIGIALRPWQQAVDAFLQREGLLDGKDAANDAC